MTFATFDSAAKNARITLSGGDLTATHDAVLAGGSVLATVFKSSGKWYCEITIGGSGSLHRVGITQSSLSLADDSLVGADATSYAYTFDGEKYNNGIGAAYGAGYAPAAVISIVWDADAGSLSFWKNGVDQGVAYTGITGSYCFAVSLDQNDAATANFGASAWAYTPPGGYAGMEAPAGPTTSSIAIAAPVPTLITGFDGMVLSAPVPDLITGPNSFIGSAPKPTLNMGDTGVRVTTFAPTLSATMVQRLNTAACSIPAPTLSCSVLTGEVITFAGTAPKPALECHTKDARLTVPAPTLSATLLSGSIITVTARVAPPILVATLVNPAIITASMIVRPPRLSAVLAGPAPSYARTLTVAVSIPAPRLSAVLLAGNTASAILTLRAPSITAQILTGNVATVLATVAAPIMAAAGYPAYTITFAGTVPAPRLNATLSAAVASAFRTWVLNTKKSALTEYGSEWAMNSYTVFNGKVLGCTSSGIVELGTQSLDNATAISSTVKSGQDNFGSSVIKRLPRLYVDYVTGGDARFALITTEGGRRVYALDWNRVTGVQQRRVPIGQGPKSVRWQWEYTNVDGADFDLGAVLAYPKALRRRVQ